MPYAPSGSTRNWYIYIYIYIACTLRSVDQSRQYSRVPQKELYMTRFGAGNKWALNCHRSLRCSVVLTQIHLLMKHCSLLIVLANGYCSNFKFGNCSLHISFGSPAVLTKRLPRLPHSFQETSDALPQIVHDRFLRHCFKFIVPLPLNRSTLCNTRKRAHKDCSAYERKHSATLQERNKFCSHVV
jgi:hypothetical protein